MSSEREPSMEIWERAAELWVCLLRNPKYDNLGDGPSSPEERMSCGMASVMASMLPNNATDEILELFRAALLRRMTDTSKSVYSRNSLHVDYGPDEILGDAAKEAGLKMQFPWKTNMWVGDNNVSVRNGYGAEAVCHYPLGDGRWLVTTLSGSDIAKVIELVNGGTPTFKVETTQPALASA